MKKQEKEESEFGKGLIVCLAKFSEHFADRWINRVWDAERYINNPELDLSKIDINDRRNIETFQRVELAVIGDPKKALSNLIESWANGASDHLYDIQIPKQWKKTNLARKVGKLRNLGLTMGHGFTGKLWTTDDIVKLRKLVEEICLEIDKRIGIIEGDWGQW